MEAATDKVNNELRGLKNIFLINHRLDYPNVVLVGFLS